MFHSNFSRHQHLPLCSAEYLSKGCGSHCRGYADFGLATAHGCRNGSTFFKYAAHLGGCKHELDDLILVIPVTKNSIVLKYRRNHTRSAISGCSDYPSEGRVFFINGKGKTTDPVKCVLKIITACPDAFQPAIVIIIVFVSDQSGIQLSGPAFYVQSTG